MTLVFRSPCPVASALDLVGDKWTLVVLRAIFSGLHRYSELAGIQEKIATNILADRLAWLEQNGLVTRTLYQEAPARFEYRLTRAGADLLPVLKTLAHWAESHLPARERAPDWCADGKPEDFYPAEET